MRIASSARLVSVRLFYTYRTSHSSKENSKSVSVLTATRSKSKSVLASVSNGLASITRRRKSDAAIKAPSEVVDTSYIPPIPDTRRPPRIDDTAEFTYVVPGVCLRYSSTLLPPKGRVSLNTQ